MSIDLDVTLPQLTAAFTAAPKVRGGWAVTLPSLTTSWAADPHKKATIAVVLPSLTTSWAIAPRHTLRIVAALPSLTTSWAAIPRTAAVVAATLPSLTAAITAVPRTYAIFDFSYAFNMGVYTYVEEATGGAVIGARGAYVYDDPLINVGSGGVEVGGMAGADFPLNAGVTAVGGVEIGGGADDSGYSLSPEMDVTLPVMTVDMTGVGDAGMALTFPVIELDMSGSPGAIGDLAVTLRAPQVSMTGGEYSLAVKLPVIRQALTGFVGDIGDLAVTLPVITTALTGNPAIAGDSAMLAPKMAVSFTGQVGTSGDLAVDVPVMQVDFTGNPGMLGDFEVSLPTIATEFIGYTVVTGSMAMSFPPIQVQMLATLRSQLQLLLAVNTVTNAISTYEGLQTNSMCQFGAHFLFADATGVHAMDADDDNATPIDASMQTGILDLGSGVQKRVSDLYAGMRASGDLIVRVGVDENPAYEYTLEPKDIATLKQRRVNIGKGLRGKYWQFEVSNKDGCDFDFDSFDISVADTARRI